MLRSITDVSEEPTASIIGAIARLHDAASPEGSTFNIRRREKVKFDKQISLLNRSYKFKMNSSPTTKRVGWLNGEKKNPALREPSSPSSSGY